MMPIVHEIGARVSRKAIQYLTDPSLPDRLGTVTNRYVSAPKQGVVQYHWLCYSVQWDDTGLEESGYFAEGLTPVLPVDTTILKVEGLVKT